MEIATQIIDLVIKHAVPLSLTYIAQSLGLTKATASRQLTNLEQLGLVTRGDSGRGFSPGWLCYRWASLSSETLRPNLEIMEAVSELRDKTDKTILLSVPAGIDAMVIGVQASELHRDSKALPNGLLLSAPNSPSALVCIAFRPQLDMAFIIEQLSRRNPNFTANHEKRFIKRITDTRRKRYAYSENKHSWGWGAIAVPVINTKHEVFGALSVIFPAQTHLKQDEVLELVKELNSTAQIVPTHIGKN